MNTTWKKLGLTAVSASALFLAACDDDTAGDGAEIDTVVDGDEITLAYVSWDSEIASTNVLGLVLEDMGYDVTLTALDNAIMWEAIASGDADAMVSAWLPQTHAPQLEQHEDNIVHLGTNLEGAVVGFVVPEYMDVDSIADLTDEAGMTITGIEPGAGVVAAAEDSLEAYENLEGWNVQTSSSGAMVTELRQAYQAEEEIIVTGWSPHWKFSSFDLKYLEDPEGVFGDAETIETFAREGLEEDAPEAFQVLDNFFWETEDMEEVMLEIEEGAEPEDAARNWIDNNPELIEEWTAGIGE
ncbi:Glycine betaine ABC transport system, glycine betaine-binding protein OpuAC [Alkalibacterium sp. AK22]|nr:Glycine betaine ABC transport system, glycine betaine-binding protein OpuAC [Alkalibacterium sp. AK22]